MIDSKILNVLFLEQRNVKLQWKRNSSAILKGLWPHGGNLKAALAGCSTTSPSRRAAAESQHQKIFCTSSDFMQRRLDTRFDLTENQLYLLIHSF